MCIKRGVEEEQRVVGGNFTFMRKNWRQLGIEELINRYGMERNVAEMVWERAYRKALRRARKHGVSSDVNIARELYGSIFNRGTQLFDIDLEDISPSVNIAEEFSQSENLEKSFIEKRFENMANKYKEVRKIINLYKRGKITYKELRELIKKFRDTNAEYQKAGS